MEPDDEAIRSGIEAGDPDWGAIYAAYRSVMRKGALSVLKSESYSAIGISVEDVVQKLMVTLMEGSGIPPDTRNVQGYLYRAARNTALNAVLREGRLRMEPWPEADSPGERAQEEEGFDEVEDTAIVEAIKSHLDILSEDELFAYTQRIEHGRTYEQIGADLGGKSDTWARRLCAEAFRKLTLAIGFVPGVEGARDA